MFTSKIISSALPESFPSFLNVETSIAYDTIRESQKDQSGTGLWNFKTGQLALSLQYGHLSLGIKEKIVHFDENCKPILHEDWAGFNIIKGETKYAMQLFSGTFGPMRERLSEEQLLFFMQLLRVLFNDSRIYFPDPENFLPSAVPAVA